MRLRHMALLLLWLFSFLPVLSARGQEPLRIASLSPAFTELLFALHAEKYLVARSAVCNFPKAAEKLPVAGNLSEPNTEVLLRNRVNFLLVNSLVHPADMGKLSQLGIQVLLLPCRNIAEYCQAVRKIADIIRQPEVTRAAEEEIRMMEAIRCHPRKCGRKFSVLWILWDSPLIAAGKNSLLAEAGRLAGVDNAADSVAAPYFKCSREWLLAAKPDVILWLAAKRDWKNDDFWRRVPAVQKNHLLFLRDSDILQRPGPRLRDGIAELHRQLEAMP